MMDVVLALMPRSTFGPPIEQCGKCANSTWCFELDITGLADGAVNGADLNGVYHLDPDFPGQMCAWSFSTAIPLGPTPGHVAPTGFFAGGLSWSPGGWVLFIGYNNQIGWIYSNIGSPLPDAFFHCSGWTVIGIGQGIFPMWDISNLVCRVRRVGC